MKVDLITLRGVDEVVLILVAPDAGPNWSKEVQCRVSEYASAWVSGAVKQAFPGAATRRAVFRVDVGHSLDAQQLRLLESLSVPLAGMGIAVEWGEL